MNWLVLVAIAVFTDALRIFIDNYISDVYFKGRDAASQKLFYGYACLFIAAILALVFHLNLSSISIYIPLLLFFSGCLTSLSGIPYYKALEIDDSTNISIFVQLAPIFYLILGWFFLGETFSTKQLIGFIIILAAPLLIILTTRRRSRKIKLRAALLAALYVLIAVVANLIFVKTSDFPGTTFSFLENIIFIYLGKGLANLVIVAVRPKWRKRFKTVFKNSHRRVLVPLISNSVVGFIKDISYRGALTIAPAVALASVASDSTLPIVIFFLGIILTLIWPRFGREKLDKKSVFVHLLATILVVTGIIILQI
ncbi:EamA family transporter [Candidatus Saccharibacteria bacterium]|nr:EamA family transporter [Candidatus Saccharibacteria bacterium]